MADLNEDYFRNNFNTPLNPLQEYAYQGWLKKVGREDDAKDYDLRGAFLDNAEASTRGHLTDKFKKPNHITFSDESIYHNTPGPLGNWQGGQWKGSDEKGWSYTPSPFMLRYMVNKDELQSYFQANEPDVKLNLPR